MMKHRLRHDWIPCIFALVMLAVSGTALASGEPDHTSLRKDAARQLKIATAAVDEAASKKALWIPAAEALEEAKIAFERGDFEQAISQARMARQFAELGIKQLDYPPYRHF